MTLDEAVRHFRWDATHDYQRHVMKDGKIVGLVMLGLYECDLKMLRSLVPHLTASVRRSVRHDAGTWVMVDVAEEAP